MTLITSVSISAGAMTKVAEATVIPTMVAAVSHLSGLESRVGPVRRRDPATLATVDAFFSRTDLIGVELTAAVVQLGTDHREQHSLRTPDALQAACCPELGVVMDA